MALLAIDEVMLREPRLLVPQMKPIGNVRIDYSHPAAKGLSVAMLFPPSGKLLVGSGQESLLSYSYLPDKGFFATGSNYFKPWTAGISTFISGDLGINGARQGQLIRAASTASTTRHCAFGDWSAAGSSNSHCIEFSGYNMTSGFIGVQLYGADPLSIAAYQANVPITIGFTREPGAGDTTVSGFHMGRLVATKTSNPLTGTSATFGRGGDYNALFLTGWIESYFAWKWAPANNLMAALTLDPYQFLIPA